MLRMGIQTSDTKYILDLNYDLLIKHIPFNSSNGSGLSEHRTVVHTAVWLKT